MHTDSDVDSPVAGSPTKRVGPVSLFDQVLHGAEELVYDSHIGQYVEKSAVEDDAREYEEDPAISGRTACVLAVAILSTVVPAIHC